MSPRQDSSQDEEDDADEMAIDSVAGSITPTAPSTAEQMRLGLAVLVRDATDWLPRVKALEETDVIILLTPIVVPISQNPTDTSDPFEPLGRALAKRHARIRQVPYTQRSGITSTHIGFIKRGHVIILCFAVASGRPIQVEFADIAFAASDNKPCIIVVCCGPVDTQQPIPFPTIIQTSGYSPPALEATAAIIFGEQARPQFGRLAEAAITNAQQPRLWPVEQWNEARDITNVLTLWAECVDERFTLSQQTLASLLRRPGYAKHYVVRDAGSGQVFGFCATFLSYVDQEGERLIASVAILIVRVTSRHRGIGLSLHSHAVSQLKRTRGVVRLQLGSTFPRILYGPPFGIPLNEEWFRRRGWQLNKDIPGQGQAVYDLVLDFANWWHSKNPPVSSCIYRPCTQADMGHVLEIAETTSREQAKMGWFDQYSSLMNGPNVKDVVLGVDGGVIVAAALTYTPSCGSQIASNLPWAGRIADDVGGVTCICVTGDKRDTILDGLLDACVVNLQSQGMKKMFLDGITEGASDLLQLGFYEWARYRDVWKDS